MKNSKFLSKVIGIYLMIISAAMLFNMPLFLSEVNLLLQNASMMFVAGFFTIIIGVLLVVSHNVWQWNWKVMITLISWLVLLKGVSLIFYPQLIDRISIHFANNMTVAYIVAGLYFIFGIIFCILGFKR